MKCIEVSIPSSISLIRICADKLRVIDDETKLVVNDEKGAIAVFSNFYYWRRVDTKDDDEEYKLDKGAQRKIVEKLE